jgi:hypothetical protein
VSGSPICITSAPCVRFYRRAQLQCMAAFPPDDARVGGSG